MPSSAVVDGLSSGARQHAGRPALTSGTNSHDGQVFQRGRENLPRGSGTLMLRCVFHDRGEGIYRALCRVAENDKTVLAFIQEFIDRTEGRPVKKVEKTIQRQSNFYLMTPDGQKQPLFPERQAAGNGATPPEESAEDRLVRVTGP
jgi:hypothetical protein